MIHFFSEICHAPILYPRYSLVHRVTNAENYQNLSFVRYVFEAIREHFCVEPNDPK